MHHGKSHDYKESYEKMKITEQQIQFLCKVN